MTRRRQLSYDCCIDLSPKVFVRRTSLNTILNLTKSKRPDTPDRKQSSEKVKAEVKARVAKIHILYPTGVFL